MVPDKARVLETTSDREETLGDLLASRARRTSELRLVGDAVFSVMAAVAVGVWRGPLWDVRIAVAICFLAFGLWGVADRDLARRPDAPTRALLLPKAVRLLAAAIGFAGAGYAMISLLGRAIGRVIS